MQWLLHPSPALKHGYKLPRLSLRCCTAFAGDFAGGVVEQQVAEAGGELDLDHGSDGVVDRVKRAIADALSVEPVVLDEVDDRRLIEQSVIDLILPSIRRDDHHGQTWTVAAASLN